MPNIPTPEQAELFAQSVRKWQHEKGIKPAKGAMASVEFTPAARLAVYRLGDFGAEKITPDSLDKTALHELLHIFLYDLLCTATDVKSSDEDREMQEHRIINTLEHLLTKDSHGIK